MTSRRQFIEQSAVAASALAFPLVGGAQAKTVKVGVLHPVRCVGIAVLNMPTHL